MAFSARKCPSCLGWYWFGPKLLHAIVGTYGTSNCLLNTINKWKSLFFSHEAQKTVRRRSRWHFGPICISRVKWNAHSKGGRISKGDTYFLIKYFDGNLDYVIFSDKILVFKYSWLDLKTFGVKLD